MQVMAQQRSSSMQHTKRDPLVGSFFIVRGEDGRPRRAGRINSKAQFGDYVVRVWFESDGSPAHGEAVRPAVVAAEGWLLFTNETSWRAAFAAMQK